MQNGFALKAVTIGEDGYTLNDILVHDSHKEDDTLQRELALMDGLELPLALGVIRDVEGLTYETEVENQISEVKGSKGFGSLREMILKTHETWEV